MLLFIIIVLFVHMQCCLHVQLTTHSARMEGHALVWVQVTPSVFVLLHILGSTVRSASREGVLTLALINRVSTEHMLCVMQFIYVNTWIVMLCDAILCNCTM